MTACVGAERWAPVKGWPYEVSSLGGVVNTRTGRRLNPYAHKGHRRVVLQDRGRKWEVDVHILVLEAFVGPRPPGLQGLHWDDNGDCNELSNLYWGTASQNLFDQVRNGRHAGARKTKCANGHDYTPENTVTTPRGRECLTCVRRAKRESWRRIHGYYERRTG